MHVDKLSGCSRVAAVLVLLCLPSACEIDGSDNLPDVPELGLFMYAEANRHEVLDEAQIAAAVFKDGQAVDLVGGDVFEARTTTERVLLKDRGLVAGSYATSLPVDDSIQEVLLNVVHEPIEAREDRWYPIDLVRVDPGPGELVGKSATVIFPPTVSITAPAADTIYTSINDVVNLGWAAVGAGDTMRVLAAVNCSDGLAVASYGAEVDIGDDDGFDAIGMDSFIFDINAGSSTVKFVTDAALMLLQELLNQLSAGNIDPDFVLRNVIANPIESACDIQLFLQRQRQGQFDLSFDDGNVVGSTSAEVSVKYLPPVQAD